MVAVTLSLPAYLRSRHKLLTREKSAEHICRAEEGVRQYAKAGTFSRTLIGNEVRIDSATLVNFIESRMTEAA